MKRGWGGGGLKIDGNHERMGGTLAGNEVWRGVAVTIFSPLHPRFIRVHPRLCS